MGTKTYQQINEEICKSIIILNYIYYIEDKNSTTQILYICVKFILC
jgi:hypothetical protein